MSETPKVITAGQQTVAARLFVYGTLRAGRGNHFLLNGAQYLGVRHTQPKFTMVSCGGFPGVLGSGDTSIVGEVYEVTNPDQLRQIDRLEGHPDWYTRTPITTIEGDEVEIYLYPEQTATQRQLPIIASGDWARRD